MDFEEVFVPRCCDVGTHCAEILECNVHMDKHVRILPSPIQQTGALREFVPDHPSFLILILDDEFKRFARPGELAYAEQPSNRNKFITGKKPGVLRTTSFSGGAVSSNRTTAEISIAHPRLIECNFGPGKRLVHGRIGSFDLQSFVLEFGVMSGCTALQFSVGIRESLCQCSRVSCCDVCSDD